MSDAEVVERVYQIQEEKKRWPHIAFLYQPNCLIEDESWELLQRRAFQIKPVFDRGMKLVIGGLRPIRFWFWSFAMFMEQTPTLGVSNWGKEREGGIKLIFFLNLKNFGAKLENNM